jgi:hypothetical protein
MAEATTKTIYREQGTDPTGTTVGDRLIGIVHRDVPAAEADYLIANKKFREVTRDFDPKKAPAPVTPPLSPPKAEKSAPEAGTKE